MDCDNKGGQIDKKVLGHLKSPRVKWFKQRSGANLSQIWSGLSSKIMTIFVICVGQENLIKTAREMYLTFWYQKCIDRLSSRALDSLRSRSVCCLISLRSNGERGEKTIRRLKEHRICKKKENEARTANLKLDGL
jgi:hypothetical protein